MGRHADATLVFAVPCGMLRADEEGVPIAVVGVNCDQHSRRHQDDIHRYRCSTPRSILNVD